MVRRSIWTRANPRNGLERPRFWEPLAAQKNRGVAPAPQTGKCSVCEVLCPCPRKRKKRKEETHVDHQQPSPSREARVRIGRACRSQTTGPVISTIPRITPDILPRKH